MTVTLSTQTPGQDRHQVDTSLLDAAREIGPIIRAHSDEAEQERRLSRPVLDALREAGLTRMTTPRSLGGLETDPVTRALVGEEVGRHDSAAGWALLVVHPVNGRLYNVVSDEHAQGPMWLSVPLVVLDTYEHAFYIDYQNRKSAYLEKFLDFIDWTAADHRWRFRLSCG